MSKPFIYKHFKLLIFLQSFYYCLFFPDRVLIQPHSVGEVLEGVGGQDGEERGGDQQEDPKVQSDSAQHASSEVPC